MQKNIKTILYGLKASLRPAHVIVLGIACVIVLIATTPLVFNRAFDDGAESASYTQFTTKLFEAKGIVAKEIGYTGNIDFLKIYSAGGCYSYRLLDADGHEIDSGNFTSQAAILKMNEALRYGDYYDEATSGVEILGVTARSFYNGIVGAGFYLAFGAIVIFVGCAFLMGIADDNLDAAENADKTDDTDVTDGTNCTGNADTENNPTNLNDLLKPAD